MKEHLIIYLIAIAFVFNFINMNIKTIIPSKRFTKARIAAFIGLGIMSFFIFYKSKDFYLLLPLLVITIGLPFYKTGVQENVVVGYGKERLTIDRILKAVIRRRKDELLVSIIGNKRYDANLIIDYKYEDKIYNWLNNNINIVEK